MSYHLEALGDERFQQLCQALLVLVFPNIQCLPVGQPDGGRDGFNRRQRGPTEDLAIFQVKFVKNPAVREARDFIEEILKSERSKVRKLIGKGATSYYLITNVAGTAHLETGSIDKAEAILTKELGIPAYCWWRDDVERRIDVFPAVKWSFPDILRATDLLEALISKASDPDMKRRSDAIRAYMAYQAKNDAQLKFKQVDLQKTIGDLFVDVPSRLLAANGVDEREHFESWARFFNNHGIQSLGTVNGHHSRPEFPVGALELMVCREFSEKTTRLVVEGAPGQGKSTITQYLCQVNRLKLLNRVSEFSRVEPKHRPAAARIPFRIDLRDYANWLSGKDPFSDGAHDPLPQGSTPVLESFIAAQVHRHTGATFTVDDLTAISSSSQILIVLDGFDEVADIRLRNRIVDEVSAAAERIAENAISSQIVVTSRPAVFANSPGFSRDEWQYLEILPLVREVIDQYAEKWLRGRSVDKKERHAITAVLNEKLSLPHVRDLARNPMQLAILLNLISVQGSSLPNKRTELYDNYIDIFLNREAEKSEIVRDHRPLLVQIHRYLAWRLQSEAEDSGGSGNIAESRLKEVLRNYLEENGHKSDLVDRLFTGMVERVVALVSRVQGTFEFEVQPLREYFAARHLYDTARYMPGSRHSKGTKPDRFDALARNFYWLNVTRFYAGCYTSGELASLIDGLDDLLEAKQFKYIGYTAELGITLLNDHVFSLHPKLANRLAEKLTGAPSFEIRLSEKRRNRANEVMIMPEGAGREVLVEYAKNNISPRVGFEKLLQAAKILAENSSRDEIMSYWESLRPVLPPRKWVAFGQCAGLVNVLPAERLVSMLRDGIPVEAQSIAHERPDVFKGNSDLWAYYFDELFALRSLHIPLPFLDEGVDAEYAFACSTSRLLWPYLFLDGPSGSKKASVIQNFSRYFYPGPKSATSEIDGVNASKKIDEPYRRVAELGASALLQSWDAFVSQDSEFPVYIEACRDVWGDRWMFFLAAMNFVQGSNYRSQQPEIDLLDCSVSICDRASFAYHQKDLAWWKSQINAIQTGDENNIIFTIGSAFRGLDLSDFLFISAPIEDLISKIPDGVWSRAARSIRPYIYKQKPGTLPSGFDAGSLSPRLAALILPGLKGNAKKTLWKSCLKNYSDSETDIWQEMCDYIVSIAISKPACWDEALNIIGKAYARGVDPHLGGIQHRDASSKLPRSTAEKVCANFGMYPMDLVAAASSVLTSHTGADAIGLGKISARDEWFEE